MSKTCVAPRLYGVHLAAFVALLFAPNLFAADTPTTPEKCDCKPMQVVVTRALAVGNRANSGVTIQNFTFTGSAITVNVGDTVTWTNTDSAPHTVTSDTGAFDSGVLTSGGNPFSFTFNAAGSFPYHCNIHPFMTGTVTVQAPPPQAPIITSATTAQSLAGANFSYTFTAIGNPAPTLSFSNVPAELIINGSTISGAVTTAGVYLIGLSATNGVLPDASNTLTLTVGTAPTITSGTSASSPVGAPFSYTLTATGSPAPTPSFTNVPAGLTVSGATLSGSLASSGQFAIGLQAANQFGTDTKTLLLSTGTAPAITSPLFATAVVNASFTYTLTGSGSPPPTLSYPTPPAGLIANGPTLSGTFTTVGQVMVPVRAANAIDTVNKILIVEVGTTPMITSPLAVTTTVGASFMYTLTATGAPTPIISFTSVPVGFQTNGPDLTGTFGQTGQVSILLHATNALGTVDQTLVVTVNPASDAAVITSPLSDSVLVGANYSYKLSATGNPSPALSLTNVPADFTVNAAGDTFSGTAVTPGTYSIGLHASNAAGADDKTLVLIVGSAATITSAITDKVLVGAPYTYTLTASGSPTPALSFTNQPTGFTVNGATLSGTFTSAGVVSIGIHAANTFATDDKTLVITAGTAPSITSALTATSVVGSNFSYSLTADGSPAPVLTFTNLPVDLAVNGTTLIGSFKTQQSVSVGIHATNVFGADDKTLVITAGTPPLITSPLTATVLAGAAFTYTLTATGGPTPALSFTNLPGAITATGPALSGTFSSPGTVTIALHAINPLGSDDRNLVINVATLPNITSAQTANAVIGTPFSYTATATGSPSPIFSFDSVPADLTANGAALSGTFTAEGTFTVGIHATNLGGTADSTLTITVREAPAITSSLQQTVVAGADFRYVIVATGTAPQSFAAANLPASLTLSGAVISGRVDAANTYSIPLTVTNDAGSTTKNLVLTVSPNTAGIGGNWSGKLKGKEFDQTGDRPQNFADSKTLAVSFTQVDSDLYAKVSFDGGASYLLQGRIGLNNFWITGKDTAGTSTVTLSGHVDKKLKSIKGQGLVFTPAGSEEFTLTLTKGR